MATVRDVHFSAGDETLKGVLATPDADGSARASLVMMHGLASDHREFGDAPARLADRGFAVLAFDRRGHGGSTGERGRLSKAWAVADAKAAAAFVAKEAPDAPIGLMGHSLGGPWALAALAETRAFRAGALLAPVRQVVDELRLPGEEKMYRLANRVSKVKAKLGLGPLVVPYKNDYPRLFYDEEAAKRAQAIGFLQDTINLGDFDEFLAVDGEAWAKDVHVPTLVVVAKFDKAVRNASSVAVYKALGGAKRLEVVESGHSMFLDCASDAVIDHLATWFHERLDGADM